jgi:hypothetical protein
MIIDALPHQPDDALSVRQYRDHGPVLAVNPVIDEVLFQFLGTGGTQGREPVTGNRRTDRQWKG